MIKRMALLLVALLLLIPASALADPTRPGIESSQVGVYDQAGQEGESISNPGGGPGGGSGNEGEAAAPGGGVEAAGPGDQGETGGGSSKLPFTGLSAALMLGFGLSVLGGGFVVRAVSKRPTRA